ncbi:MAG: CvpA family protein [Planctomycetota bacterium]|jgi:hypothetical protein
MANLIVVLVILGCAAYHYLKGTLVKSFAMVITAICASVVAFAYFELLGNVIASRSAKLELWAQPLSFVLLFVLAFAVLQTIAGQLTRQPVDLGLLPERLGRVVCGILLGLIISGLLLTALAMAPLPTNYPYQRFNKTRPDAEKPKKALFNADGLATGWFNIVSSGSFSGKRSFATLHPAFLDQVFLNRHKIKDEISIITSSDAIEIPKKKAAWPAPEALRDSEDKPVPLKSGRNLTIVRVGIKKAAVKTAGRFTLSQLRLVCKERSRAKNPFAGTGRSIYPIGYLKTADQLQIKQLNDEIKLDRADFDAKVRWIDFAFYVPNGFIPVLAEFKQNNIAQVPPPVSYEQAPPAVPFVLLSECARDVAKLQPITLAKIYGVELTTRARLLTDLTLEIGDPNQWQNAQTARSIKPAQFDEEGKITCVRAELKIEESAQEESEEDEEKTWQESEAFSKMLKPLNGYRLLSLKCNNPSTGVAIKAEQLPVLVELSGLIHRPVGVVASGTVGGRLIYEVDYCSLTDEAMTGGLTIAEDGSIAQPFPDTVWLTKQAQSISEFYVLYLVETGRNVFITAVQPTGSQMAAAFKGYEAFFVK